MSDSEPFFPSPRVTDASPRRAAIAPTIAGSDTGGGAGIRADLETFSALGIYGASVVTALTARNTRTVRCLRAAIARADELGVGNGRGPVHHFRAHRPVGA